MRQTVIAGFAALAVSTLSATTACAEERFTVIRLELRDRVVTITSISTELRYSVLAKNGTVIDADLNETQLQAKHPEVYSEIRPAVASPKAAPKQFPLLDM
ncbi:MAG: hypothetical protein HC866_16345 [Leptolyngbyaceae cyanobacterium RU_5_1]|nr:hypothetical protein [Leptolyngbyaceae cyanobacterium RU_5_1]